MDKHLNTLVNLYIWFYMKYNDENINIKKLTRVSESTITYYLEHDITSLWNWECDRIKQIYEKQNRDNNPEHK